MPPPSAFQLSLRPTEQHTTLLVVMLCCCDEQFESWLLTVGLVIVVPNIDFVYSLFNTVQSLAFSASASNSSSPTSLMHTF